MSGDLNIILDRKGSGKSAIFIQARNKVRSNRNNVVVDLAPEGFQPIKLKEFVLEQLSLGTRKELIAEFWEYNIWLEIACKLPENDEMRARNDSSCIPRSPGPSTSGTPKASVSDATEAHGPAEISVPIRLRPAIDPSATLPFHPLTPRVLVGQLVGSVALGHSLCPLRAPISR